MARKTREKSLVLDALRVDNKLTVAAPATFSDTVTVTGAQTVSATQTYADDTLLRFGTDGDEVLVSRSTTLAANTALTSVLVGTPASAATPANSLLMSNVTADGDIAFFTRNAAGANSIEALRLDASAGLIVFNEAAADWDVRIEGDNNANMLVIDGGTDSAALGAAVVAGAFLTIDGSAVNRAGVTAVGRGEHMPTATFTQTNADPTTLAIGARVVIGIPTFAGANANQTITDAAALYIAGAAAAGTNVTLTRNYAMWVDAGEIRADGGITVADRGTVTQATSITTGVTLNNRSGAITTVSTTLAAGAEAEFVVTNSTVGANDVVIANLAATTSAGTPAVVVSRVAAGSFTLQVQNLHATAALDNTLVINFVVIGGDV